MVAPPVQSVPGLRQRDQGLIGSRPLGVALSSAPAPRFPRPAMRGHPGVRVGRRDGREHLHPSRSRKEKEAERSGHHAVARPVTERPGPVGDARRDRLHTRRSACAWAAWASRALLVVRARDRGATAAEHAGDDVHERRRRDVPGGRNLRAGSGRRHRDHLFRHYWRILCGQDRQH